MTSRQSAEETVQSVENYDVRASSRVLRVDGRKKIKFNGFCPQKYRGLVASDIGGDMFGDNIFAYEFEKLSAMYAIPSDGKIFTSYECMIGLYLERMDIFYTKYTFYFEATPRYVPWGFGDCMEGFVFPDGKPDWFEIVIAGTTMRIVPQSDIFSPEGFMIIPRLMFYSGVELRFPSNIRIGIIYGQFHSVVGIGHIPYELDCVFRYSGFTYMIRHMNTMGLIQRKVNNRWELCDD